MKRDSLIINTPHNAELHIFIIVGRTKDGSLPLGSLLEQLINQCLRALLRCLARLSGLSNKEFEHQSGADRWVPSHRAGRLVFDGELQDRTLLALRSFVLAGQAPYDLLDGMGDLSFHEWSQTRPHPFRAPGTLVPSYTASTPSHYEPICSRSPGSRYVMGSPLPKPLPSWQLLLRKQHNNHTTPNPTTITTEPCSFKTGRMLQRNVFTITEKWHCSELGK